jgi:FtsP/CotA-like multicopper oxidase with cupredoxin domain
VAAATEPDPTTPPEFLKLPALAPLPEPLTTRRLALIEMMSEFHDGPAEALLGTVYAENKPAPYMWMESITENPNVGDTEIWEFYNFTADAHPMHVHEVVFEVLDRQRLELNEDEETAVPVKLRGEPRPPEPWERGWKDTVIAYPGEVTRIRARFDKAGQFVWHCHIVEHEDNEMMRPYRIGPADPTAPDQMKM